MLLRNLLIGLGFLAIIGCTSGGTPFRLLMNNKVCGEDEKETDKVTLADKDLSDFYNTLAPIADLDRAVQTAGKDDPKIKKPDVQKKIGSDILESCFVTDTPATKDFSYQTYKNNKSIKGGKSQNKQCPITLEQSIAPVDSEALASAGTVDTKVTKSEKSKVDFRWLKADATYKFLGPIQSLDFSGIATTDWHNVSPQKNIQVTVNEDYNLKTALDGNRQITGHQKICKAFQQEADNRRKLQIRYETTVVRIKLNFEKFKAEGKFITVIKQYLDKNNNWINEKSLRNDFFINNILLTDTEITGLETKRQNAIGFTKP